MEYKKGMWGIVWLPLIGLIIFLIWLGAWGAVAAYILVWLLS